MHLLPVSPFPGFNPDKIDRDNRSRTVINKWDIIDRDDSMVSVIDTLSQKKKTLIPEGYTEHVHPILWPCHIPNLTPASQVSTDFPLNAPVVLEIYYSDLIEIQLVLFKVTGYNKEDSLSIPKNNGDFAIGDIFNVYVCSRHSDDWICIELTVVDNNYQDGNILYKNVDVDIMKPKPFIFGQRLTTKADYRPFSPDKAGDVVNFPYPAGYSPQDDPLFAPGW